MEETIELREIINIILRGKWLISLIVIIALLLAGIVSWFVIPEKYESKAVVQVIADAQDTGIINSYVNAEFTPVIYTQRIQNEAIMDVLFKQNGFGQFTPKNLVVSSDVQTNLINLNYRATNAEEAQKQLQLLTEETKNQMNESVQTTLLNLEKTHLAESENLAKEVEVLMEKYNQLIISNNLPEVLILQTISTEQYVLNLNENQTAALASINGAMQNELSRLKSEIDIKSEQYRQVLANYQSVKTGLDSFKPDPFIRVIVEPTLPKEPSAPNKAINLLVALVFGVIIGLGVVFFREYWRKSAVVK
ncbi:Wzz/FepE/Etk N-terminal domain-containing protein [Solibacillus daqui]|uniref:Wzz/FepE/Etk N-terminal domain-containing protein n=1 Tax=Solibacillus daqui TaxID=2912187 RepID=UPI0023660A85|nr:Wzz/FepE/Etk N-terminal domain-containing protein [Solibacillus daqui]